jgi:carbonic anhydrase
MKKLIFMLLLLWACAEPSLDSQHNAQEEKAKTHDHWSYQGETGPSHWAEIEKGSDCAGKHQSPVNIIEINTKQGDKRAMALEFIYEDSTRIHDVVNNGHSIQYNFELGDYINFKGQQYDLKQIHFHEPSEHTINGVRYPIEMHMVHAGKDGELTVLGIMGIEGENSAPFQFLENYLPVKTGETKTIDTPFNLNLNLPEDNQAFYYYKGSLTTPPCSENVNWIVFKNPITLSVEQVKVLQDLMPINNYRNEQPLNERVVLRSF